MRRVRRWMAWSLLPIYLIENMRYAWAWSCQDVRDKIAMLEDE